MKKRAGVRHPSIANQKAIEKRLLKERATTLKFMKSIPDMDAYAYLYSNLSYLVKHIDECLDHLKDGFRMAKESLKANKDQYPNRGKQWCHHNDSRRKPSTRTQDAAGSSQEAS